MDYVCSVNESMESLNLPVIKHFGNFRTRGRGGTHSYSALDITLVTGWLSTVLSVLRLQKVKNRSHFFLTKMLENESTTSSRT